MSLKMLAPGMYERDGELHIDVAEIAEETGHDPFWVNENIERLLALAWAEAYPEAPLPEVEVLDGPPAWKGQG